MLALALAAVISVQPGQTLSGIAQQHGVSLNTLEAQNPNITNPNFITAGEQLSLGGSQGSSQSPSAVPDQSQSTQSVSVAPSASSDSPGGFSGSSCIEQRESGGNPHAVNPASGASGLFQDLPSTWNGYDGYAEASDAPASVQIQFNQQLSQTQGLSAWAADGCPGT